MGNHAAKAPSRKRKHIPTTQEMRCVSCAACGRELVGLLDAEFAAMHGMMLAVFVERRPYCRGCKPPEPTVKCGECGKITLVAATEKQGHKRYCLACAEPRPVAWRKVTGNEVLRGDIRRAGSDQVERFATKTTR